MAMAAAAAHPCDPSGRITAGDHRGCGQRRHVGGTRGAMPCGDRNAGEYDGSHADPQHHRHRQRPQAGRARVVIVCRPAYAIGDCLPRDRSRALPRIRQRLSPRRWAPQSRRAGRGRRPRAHSPRRRCGCRRGAPRSALPAAQPAVVAATTVLSDSPRAAARAPSRAASTQRNCAPATATDQSPTASSSASTGSTIAVSAVTYPLSPATVNPRRRACH